MALHHSLRDLVAVRGAGVVDEAEEFRGVLDDFLAEDEATLGELNLLVDAVRLGALRRVLDVMANGAAGQAAIREAGAALARDRGTDDPTRSCWALASLAFALGKVDESMVRTFLGDTGTMSAPSRPVPPAPAPDPVASGPTTAERPVTEVLPDGAGPPGGPADGLAAPPRPVPGPSPAPPTTTPFGGPVPRVIPEERSSRAGVYLLVVLVGLLLGGLVATGVILLGSDDDPTASDDPTSDTPRDNGSDRRPLVPASAIVVPFIEDDLGRIYQVDTRSGASEPLTTEGVDARLPTITPDRRTLTYQVGATPAVVRVVDLETGAERDLFDAESPCARAGRPAWSLDGSRMAINCAGNDDEVDGIWIANADGSGLTGPIVPEPRVSGAATWVSDTEFVFAVEEVEGSPLTFWKMDADGEDPEPLDVQLDGYLTHVDWSPATQRLLFLVSPDDEPEGAVWTVDVDGGDPQLVVDGSFAHPVWSPDGEAIGGTAPDENGETVLGYIPLDDPENPVALPDPPPGEVSIPVWGTR